MKKQFTLTQEDFEALLGWLSENRAEAGRQYELIRDGLVRFFRFRGCADPNALADETINRAAAKISTFDDSKNIKPLTYFYGFASNVFFEYSKTIRNREFSLDSDDLSSARNLRAETAATNLAGDCLENCLLKLPREESALVIEYYGKDKSEKFEERRKLADALNLKMPALHTRVFRIRNMLRECVKNCVKKKSL